MTEAADETLGEAADDGAIDALIAEERATLDAASTPEPAQPAAEPIRVGSELLMAWAGGRELMVRRADVYSNGRRRGLEPWRRPTHAELGVLPTPEEARFLRGGPEEPEKRKWVPWAIAGGVVVAAVGGGALAWKYWPRGATSNPELDDEDDGGEDDEDPDYDDEDDEEDDPEENPLRRRPPCPPARLTRCSAGCAGAGRRSSACTSRPTSGVRRRPRSG